MRIFSLILLLLFYQQLFAQQGWWQASLNRNDGNVIRFTFEWKKEKGKDVWYIKNATERLKVKNFTVEGDSIFIQMPVFESRFRIKKEKNKLTGVWIKHGASRINILPFVAVPGNKRFYSKQPATKNITGRWAVNFADNDSTEISVGEFKQLGNYLTGTFLNASGDYRFLEGIVAADSLFLSAFDGSHSFLFTAKIASNNKIVGGNYFSGPTYKSTWQATKNAKAKLSLASVAMKVKRGEENLHFSFPDMDSNIVSINDERFKNKVVVIQLMGSWCPNCMDETAYLTEYYNKNKSRGVEVIALAYEYTTNRERSIKSLKKFQQNFNVPYPILLTPVAVTDSLKTEKTLPEVTPIKSFPSTIIIDKKGKIRKIDTEFNGPATGVHYQIYKNEFEGLLNKLLKEE